MKLVILIDGESANDLFAVGPKDLINHFLPKYLGVATKDIKRCWFEEVDGNPWENKKYTVTTHPDNYESKS